MATHMGLCDTQFSAVMRRSTLYIGTLWSFDDFKHITLVVTKMWITSIRCFQLRRKTPEVHVSFEIIASFLSLIGLSENVEEASCNRNMQWRKDKTIIRIVHPDTVNIFRPNQSSTSRRLGIWDICCSYQLLKVQIRLWQRRNTLHMLFLRRCVSKSSYFYNRIILLSNYPLKYGPTVETRL